VLVRGYVHEVVSRPHGRQTSLHQCKRGTELFFFKLRAAGLAAFGCRRLKSVTGIPVFIYQVDLTEIASGAKRMTFNPPFQTSPLVCCGRTLRSNQTFAATRAFIEKL